MPWERGGCVHVCVQSYLIFETPWTAAHQAPLSMGFSREGYWSGLPFPSPGNLSDPDTEPMYLLCLLHWQANSLPPASPGQPWEDGVRQMYPGVKWVKEVGDGLAHCRTNKFLSAASPTLECMPEFFLYKDACHQSCPSHFYADRRHCVPCHEDCLECSGPSADDCDLCADTSLVLYDGQCLDECPEQTYLEKETQVCKGKISGCVAKHHVSGSP